MELKARQLLNPSSEESVGTSLSSNLNVKVPYALQIPSPRFPELYENVIEVSVCHVEETSHFWCHRIDNQSKREYREITKLTVDCGKLLHLWDPAIPIHKGNLVMGPFKVADGKTEYYRAKVLGVQRNVPYQDRKVRLYLIDFGNAAMALVSELRVLPVSLLKIPPLALECRLTGVGPSFIRNLKGNWDNDAKKWFELNTVDQFLDAKVKPNKLFTTIFIEQLSIVFLYHYFLYRFILLSMELFHLI